MKIKIRGLVFVGFAAAVFAQSALAEITADDKTVTSKTYVDSKVEATVNNATTITAGSPDDKAPSSLNVYKFVEGRIVSSGGGVDGNETYHTKKIGYLNSTWAQANTNLSSPYMVTEADILAHASDADPWGDHVTKWEIIVPDARVAESASDISDAGDSNASVTVQTNLTTAKAVYDFVTNGDPDDPENPEGFQRKITEGEANALHNFNYNSATNSYGTAGRGVMIGYRGNNEGDPSTWYILGARENGDGTNNDNHLSYLRIDEEIEDESQARPKFLVDIKDSALAKNATAISAAGVGGAALITTDKLTTAQAVYDYAVQKQWQTTDEGKHLVIGSDGKVTLSADAGGLPPESTMPEACSTANGNYVCALVAYYDANAGGTGVGGVKYEWTVMAPTGNNG